MLAQIDITSFLTIIGAGLTALALWGITWRRVQKQKSPMPVVTRPDAPDHHMLTFDFDQTGKFLFANDTGDRFLHDLSLEAAGWSKFRAALLTRFPDIPARHSFAERTTYARYDAISPADPAQCGIEMHADGISLQMYTLENRDLSVSSEAHQVFSKLADFPVILSASQHAPYPVWQSKPDGTVTWANNAYRTLENLVHGKDTGTSDQLFALPDTRTLGAFDRVCVRVANDKKARWFDVFGQTCGDGTLNFAYDIEKVITAEVAQRNFVQTLAKTFAHLSTGLAIFNRDRELVLFNPSLIDLTRLRADFLSARPHLFSVFDQLRNNHIMPEPKDYASWRERMNNLVSDAAADNFCETWTLPSSQTYRITGRPHPDGAIAFLFEDISAEISLTRKFRGEMEITQSALNALGEGFAIFSASGALIQCNQAMMQDWNVPQAQDDAPMTITDMSRIWQKHSLPSPVWGEIRDFVTNANERANWTSDAILKNGQTVSVSVAPIAAGATLVTTQISKQKAVVRKAQKQQKTRTAAA